MWELSFSNDILFLPRLTKDYQFTPITRNVMCNISLSETTKHGHFSHAVIVTAIIAANFYHSMDMPVYKMLIRCTISEEKLHTVRI